MAPSIPVRFMRKLTGGRYQEAGNRVQLEDANGVPYTAGGGGGASLPTISTVYNSTLTLANTEYSILIPNNAVKVTFRCRSNTDIRWAWVQGKVAAPTAPYSTLPGDSEYSAEADFEASAINNLYLACSEPGAVVEFEAWS